LKLEERRDGSGTIYFGDQPSYWYGAHSPRFITQQGVGTQFFRIADAKQVYTIDAPIRISRLMCAFGTKGVKRT
jgi:hypothetical protein